MMLRVVEGGLNTELVLLKNELMFPLGIDLEDMESRKMLT